jgi:hypothetical protein
MAGAAISAEALEEAGQRPHGARANRAAVR